MGFKEWGQKEPSSPPLNIAKNILTMSSSLGMLETFSQSHFTEGISKTRSTAVFKNILKSISIFMRIFYDSVLLNSFPLDTDRKLNIYKTFSRSQGRLLNVWRKFSLRPVSKGGKGGGGGGVKQEVIKLRHRDIHTIIF